MQTRPPCTNSAVPTASLIALGSVAVIGVAVALTWRGLIDINQPFDGLLASLWIGMTILLACRVRPAQDLCLAGAAFAGGFLIEWWGTSTSLWTYFTGESPPLWILPAWPVAALATDRLARASDRIAPNAPPWVWKILGFGVLVAFSLAMAGFMRPALTTNASRAVLVIMAATIASCRTPKRDLLLFLAGSALGWLLEYWGTTRECWTYYTSQTPPLVTAFAHGFASVAFSRVTGLLLRVVQAPAVRERVRRLVSTSPNRLRDC